MQNKGALWTFTLLLIAACLFQISFTWVVSSVENDARSAAESRLDSILQVNPDFDLFQQDSALQSFEAKELVSRAGDEVYPILGYTYAYCKKRELNLGLDLQGGMHVTLQVSVPDMLNSLAGTNRNNPTFNKILDKARELRTGSDDDFITLFEKAQNEVAPEFALTSVFHTLDNKELIPADATNNEIYSILSAEAEQAIKRTEEVLRKRVDNLGVVQPNIQRISGTGRITVELPGVKDKERVRKILQGTAQLEFYEAYQNYEIYPGLERANNILRETEKNNRPDTDDTSSQSDVESEAQEDIADLLEDDNEEDASDEGESTNESEVDSSSTADEDDALEKLLSDDETDEQEDVSREEFMKENPLFAVLQPQQEGGQPMVGIASMADTARINTWLKRKDIKGQLPPRTNFFWGANPLEGSEEFYGLYAAKVPKGGEAKLQGDDVTQARVGTDPLGNPTVNMNMNSRGTKIWRDMTREASSDPDDLKSVMVVLDDRVYSAPRVQGEIPSGQTEITGRFTQQDAADLAGVLKAGKLPARSNIIEEAVVGPELGEESISAGFSSFVIALALVLVYMIFYYSHAGIVANIALVTNVFFVIGVLASLRATLTLPGIAGIVLTIGMSVDANVLIFERIREELRAGKGLKLSITDGYKNAYSSILDANITTLLTGIILAIFGTGPIQGFATTLIIGILTSLFCAIFITRLLFEWRMESTKNIKFSTTLTEKILQNPTFEFVNRRKTFYIASGALILIGLGSLFTRGLNVGVDFSGGRSYIVRFDQPVNTTDISTALGDVFVGEDGIRQVPQVKTFGSSNQVKIVTKYMIDNPEQDVESIVEIKLFEGVKPFYTGDITRDAFQEQLTSQKVEPTIADDIKRAAVLAVIFSLIVIFLYILFRFKKWQYSLGALVAMTHDVLVVLSIFSLAYGFLPFSLEIDQAFIAAILTVVGYSINDTVVVFDRIREYIGLHPKHGQTQQINSALNSTLSRTINTSMTTFVVLLIIFIFGGEVIRGFVFALMIGVIVGTYSSLAIATPIMIDFSRQLAGNSPTKSEVKESAKA